jgi:hypothetical protein
MKLLIPCLLLTFVFVPTGAYPHKDRIEKSQMYRFIFSDGESLTLNNPRDSLLTACVGRIITLPRKILPAPNLFKSP